MDDLDDWNKAAKKYTEAIDGEHDRIYNSLKEPLWNSIGPAANKRILDAGCGNGWLTSLLLEAGADVVGIDGSVALLEMAREREPDCEFIEHDLRKPFPELGQFDLVISYMVVMDVNPLDAMFESVHKILNANGKFIFTLTHPGMFGYKKHTDDDGVFRKVRRYLEHYEFRVETFGGHTHYHRPLSYYVNLAASKGMAITRFEEPEISDSFPVFCLLEATKY